MPTINQLSAVDQLSISDLIAIYSNSNGDARKSSLNTLAQFIRSLITTPDDKNTQYYAPSATGWSAVVADSNDSVWLVITPTAGFAAGTIKLPSLGNAKDKQEILVNCTQSVTTLATDGNGATVTGAPTSLAANGYFRLRFDDVTNTWYRVG